jgi:hypothetical protein
MPGHFFARFIILDRSDSVPDTRQDEGFVNQKMHPAMLGGTEVI